MTQNVQMIKSNNQTEAIIMFVGKKHNYMYEIPIRQEIRLRYGFLAYTGEPKSIDEWGTVFTIINVNDPDISNSTGKIPEDVFISSATSYCGVESIELPYETVFSKDLLDLADEVLIDIDLRGQLDIDSWADMLAQSVASAND